MVDGGEEFRIWYQEDYRNQKENDNAGSTCTDVYALYIQLTSHAIFLLTHALYLYNKSSRDLPRTHFFVVFFYCLFSCLYKSPHILSNKIQLVT